MENNYLIYLVDTETTGLDPIQHDVIELSICRFDTQEQKTWFLRPLNLQTASSDALRVNGHKIEDLQLNSKEAKDKYQPPAKVLIEIENWILDDGVPATNRVLAGQNVNFDRSMIEQLWKKVGTPDSFPFSRRILDTMVIEFFLDLCRSSMKEGYSLANLTKHYGVKNEKAHSAEADCKATGKVLEKQIALFRQTMQINV